MVGLPGWFVVLEVDAIPTAGSVAVLRSQSLIPAVVGGRRSSCRQYHHRVLSNLHLVRHVEVVLGVPVLVALL